MEKTIFNDYSEKLKNKKLPQNLESADINQLITLLNYCFLTKNNFFIDDFNKRVIKNVYLSYNQIKTNILTPTIKEVFNSIEKDNIKLLRFIAINFVNNYDNLKNNDEELFKYVEKENIKNIIKVLSSILTK
jgi:hypothetical protein